MSLQWVRSQPVVLSVTAILVVVAAVAEVQPGSSETLNAFK